jgi:4-alpha-glucanotransferase
VNVPATSEEHPNWRRRLSLILEELSAHPRLEALCGIFTGERGAKVVQRLNQAAGPERDQNP